MKRNFLGKIPLNDKYEQLSFLPKDKKMDRIDCCDNCTYFSALRTPRQRSDGACIYGYCFQSGDTNHSSDMGKGFAVFIPSEKGSCRNFKKR